MHGLPLRRSTSVSTWCLVLASDHSNPPAAMAQENDPPPPFGRASYEKMWLENYRTPDPTEPRLPVVDEAKAAKFLDTTSLNWAGRNGCGICHTNIPYLMVRPLMSRSVAGDNTMKIVRVAMVDASCDSVTSPFRSFYAAPGAALLAINDALTKGVVSAEGARTSSYGLGTSG
jgi:hypothetical protein